MMDKPLTFKRDTWHYRNWKYWLENSTGQRSVKFMEREKYDWRTGEWTIIPAQPATLCIYFWVAVLRAPLLRLVDWAANHPAVALPVAFVLAVLVIAGAGTVLGSMPFLSVLWGVLGVILAASVLLALAAGVIYVSVEHIGPWLRDRRDRKAGDPEQDRGPSVVTEYRKAVKQKVCPFIEFE